MPDTTDTTQMVEAYTQNRAILAYEAIQSYIQTAQCDFRLAGYTSEQSAHIKKAFDVILTIHDEDIQRNPFKQVFELPPDNHTLVVELLPQGSSIYILLYRHLAPTESIESCYTEYQSSRMLFPNIHCIAQICFMDGDIFDFENPNTLREVLYPYGYSRCGVLPELHLTRSFIEVVRVCLGDIRSWWKDQQSYLDVIFKGYLPYCGDYYQIWRRLNTFNHNGKRFIPFVQKPLSLAETLDFVRDKQ